MLVVCLCFGDTGAARLQPATKRQVQSDNSLLLAGQTTAEIIISLTGFINDAYGIYVIANAVRPDNSSGSNAESSSTPPTWMLRLEDGLVNSTQSLAHRISNSNYFADEKAIVDTFRLLAVNQDLFLQAAAKVDLNVLHLLDGMLGVYLYGGDILQTTVDNVQVFIGQFD